MAVAFTLESVFSLPGGPGLPLDPISSKVSNTFSHEADFVLSLTSAGTKTVDLGTIASPGVKGLLVAVEASATAAPIKVQINGSVTGGIEIAPGGFMAVASPVPVTGTTQLDIVYTTPVVVRIWAVG